MRLVGRRVSTWLLLLGLGLLIAIVVRVDAREVLALAAQAGSWLLAAILLRMVRLACASWGWRALIAAKTRPPGWSKSVAIYWVGHALSAVSPGDALGEIAKGAFTSRSIDGAITAASLVTHRILLSASGIVAGIVGSFLCLLNPQLPQQPVLVLLAGNIVVGLVLIATWRAIRNGATPWITRMLASTPFLSERVRESLLSGGQRVDRELTSGTASGRNGEIRALAWLAVMRVLQVFEIMVLLRPLMPELEVWNLLLLALLSMSAGQLASFVGAWIPAKLGVLEGTQAVLFAALGFDPAAGVALQLLLRARTIVFVAIGLAIGWRESRDNGVTAKEPSW